MVASLLLSALALGGLAIATGRRAAAREAAAEAAFPPAGRLIEVAGRTVHAEVAGEGPDVILIHGASGNTRDFTFDLVRRLQDRYRVTVFDRPGLGWSDGLGGDDTDPGAQAALLRAAADRIGVRAPVIVGHSYGGAVAMAWGLAAPEDTGALVILGGATMPWPGGLGGWYALTSSRLGRATIVPLVTAFAPLARTEQAIGAIFAPDPVPPGYAAHIGAGLTLRRATLAANARQVNGLRPHIVRMAERYGTLDLPVQILHGTADTIVPAEIHAIPMHARLPDAELTLLPGIGHMPHHADPEATVAAIDRAVARAQTRIAGPPMTP